MKPKRKTSAKVLGARGEVCTTKWLQNISKNDNKSSSQTMAQARGASSCSKSFAFICSGCNKPIKRDKFLLKACDKYWHENCLKCDRCHSRLGELGSTLFCKADMNLCRQDYLEMFGETGVCSVCEKLICASEMVMRAKQNVYHLECFACQLCNQRFCVGDRFYLCENKVVCQYDYEENILPIQRSLIEQATNGPYGQSSMPESQTTIATTTATPTTTLLQLETQPCERGTPEANKSSFTSTEQGNVITEDHHGSNEAKKYSPTANSPRDSPCEAKDGTAVMDAETDAAGDINEARAFVTSDESGEIDGHHQASK